MRSSSTRHCPDVPIHAGRRTGLPLYWTGSSTETLFVVEDPSGRQSVRDRELQIAKARRHAALSYYRRRLTQLMPSPVKQWPHMPSEEHRFMLFYREHTSVEWLGWSDRQFWTEFTICLSHSYPAISSGLVALAMGHQGLEANDHSMQGLAIAQANKSMASINQSHCTIPRSVLLAFDIVVTQLSALINVHTMLPCLTMLSDLLEDAESNDHKLTHFVRCIFEQQCQQIDPLVTLREASMPISHNLSLPVEFASLQEARESLQRILMSTAAQVKQGISAGRHHLRTWLHYFHELRHRSNETAWKVLKAAYGMSVIQIDTLYAEDEMVYDQYMDVYLDTADAYESVLLSAASEQRYCFTIDCGLQRLVAWAAKWCREPLPRSRLIDLLKSTRCNEGFFSSHTWGRTLEALQALEESGISPSPATSADVPKLSRVRLHSVAIDWKLSMQQLNFMRWPYTSRVESLRMTYLPTEGVHLSHEPPARLLADFQPDTIAGAGYFSFLCQTHPPAYKTFRCFQHRFCLPAI